MGKPVSAQVLSLQTNSPTLFQRSMRTYARAQEAWREMGTDSLPYLLKALKRQNTPQGKLWLNVWPHLPGPIQTHLTPPVDAMSVRLAALNVLENWSEGARLAIPALCQTLKDEKWEVRCAAVRLLGRLASTDPKVEKDLPQIISALANALSDQHPGTRSAAARCLGELGEKAKSAVPALTVREPPNFGAGPEKRTEAVVPLTSVAPVTS